MISAQTAAVTSDPINLKQLGLPQTLYVVGTLDSDEEITLEYYDGTAWQTLSYSGENISLTSTGRIVTLWAPMVIRANKPLTDIAAGVQRA